MMHLNRYIYRATIENVRELLNHYLIHQVSHFNVEEMVVDLFTGSTKVQSGKPALIVTAVSVTPAIGRL